MSGTVQTRPTTDVVRANIRRDFAASVREHAVELAREELQDWQFNTGGIMGAAQAAVTHLQNGLAVAAEWSADDEFPDDGELLQMYTTCGAGAMLGHNAMRWGVPIEVVMRAADLDEYVSAGPPPALTPGDWR